MRKAFVRSFLVLSLGLSGSLFAQASHIRVEGFPSVMPARLDAFQAVMNSHVLLQSLKREASAGFSLQSLNLTTTYRCPGCYGFRADLNNGNGEIKSVSFMTELDSDSVLVVKRTSND